MQIWWGYKIFLWRILCCWTLLFIRNRRDLLDWLTVNNENVYMYIMIVYMISNLHKIETLNSLETLTSLTTHIQILALL